MSRKIHVVRLYDHYRRFEKVQSTSTAAFLLATYLLFSALNHPLPDLLLVVAAAVLPPPPPPKPAILAVPVGVARVSLLLRPPG